MKMEVKIVSEYEITEGVKTMVGAIMAQSQCPNESLINSIKGCKGLKDGIVVIGERGNFVDTIEY